MTVTVKREGRPDLVLPAAPGKKLMAILSEGGVGLDAPCGGNGKCGKCLVEVAGDLPPLTTNEKKFIKDGPTNFRLACEIEVKEPLTVKLADTSQTFAAVKGLGLTTPYQFNSPLKIKLLEAGDRNNPLPRVDILGLKSRDPEIYKILATLEDPFRSAWGISWHDELIKVETQDAETAPMAEGFVLAVDVGTTGLSAAVIDPQNHKFIGQATALNPQTTCGADVISRITYASSGPEELNRLQTLVLKGIRDLVAQTAPKEVRARIYAVAISGNTTMAHLLAGVPPYSLAQAPYRPVFTSTLNISDFASDLGVAKEAKIFLSPAISAYIGGDITSGLLAVDLLNRPGPVLFIDIGTNGELVLADRQAKLWGASCAVGPALEGMNITCGQRAMNGAIDSFNFGPGDWAPTFTTIGQETATGICGSGLIELCAALVKEGFIDKNGRLGMPKETKFKIPEKVRKQLAEGNFHLTDEICFNQKDVRQVQLAKGAVATGVEMLLEKSGLGVSDLAEIIIAGSFGFHLKAQCLQAITLLPKEYQGPITFVGNSSLAGAAKTVLTQNGLDEADRLASLVTTIELGLDKSFQDKFMYHLRFR